MSDEGSEEFKELESCEFDQNNSADDNTAVVPLDTSEDAQFSEQMFSSIQERLTRIMKRVSLANSAMAQMKRKLKTRISAPNVVENADKLAGGDNPLRLDNIEPGHEGVNE
ncbi:uncharacterized protein LOC108035075 [Drosophila biarmipes]|uniref:uncharacterized protein LOC108035075 n=1 Tax=Drosophila biarmipes TaxID=125945 RepID=UPI0007E6F524|nr:uncharacterized protein LOC108035075 [Drosophila biarmipes]